MKLSAPVHHLKRQARLLSRTDRIPLHAALDRIAASEGYSGWSLLAARNPSSSPGRPLLASLEPGDMVLIGARPGQGKTRLGLELAVEAMKTGRHAAFFTLEYAERDLPERLRAIGAEPGVFNGLFHTDCSDTIHAQTIIAELEKLPASTLAVIDYLQLLDQKRQNPPLDAQIGALRAFTRKHGTTLVVLSQIHRSFNPAHKPCPDAGDIRLPNPVDLTLFDRMIFMHGDELRVA